MAAAEAEAEAALMEVEEAAPVAVEAEPPCAAERIEMSVERDGKTHYLIKWVGCDEAENSWVASSELERYGVAAIELAASFEAGQVEDEDAELAEDEFVIDKLIGRRYAPKSGRLEYLVRWLGYGEEEDEWQEAGGLAQDLRAAYDASLRVSTRPQRGRA